MNHFPDEEIKAFISHLATETMHHLGIVENAYVTDQQLVLAKKRMNDLIERFLKYSFHMDRPKNGLLSITTGIELTADGLHEFLFWRETSEYR